MTLSLLSDLELFKENGAVQNPSKSKPESHRKLAPFYIEGRCLAPCHFQHPPLSVNSSMTSYMFYSQILFRLSRAHYKFQTREHRSDDRVITRQILIWFANTDILIQSHIFMRTFTHLGWGIFFWKIYSMYSWWVGWAIDFRRLLVMKTILRPEGDVLWLVAWKLLFLPREENLVAIMPWHALCNTMQSCYVNQQRCFCSDHISINIVLMWSLLN